MFVHEGRFDDTIFDWDPYGKKFGKSLKKVWKKFEKSLSLRQWQCK